jgi:hypothetical protein
MTKEEKIKAVYELENRWNNGEYLYLIAEALSKILGREVTPDELDGPREDFSDFIEEIGKS